jgi:hypothetical protein
MSEIRNEPTSAEALAYQNNISDRLLKERDRHIAQRINTTLGAGETGILFLGMLHNLEGLLDQDIRVIYPISKPISHGDRNDTGRWGHDPHR